jgi:arylsulfatase A-like enzyme
MFINQLKSIGLIGFSLLAANLSAQKKPNIVLILADDLGYGDVSALNKDSKIQTPNLDKFVRQGVTFGDAHSGSSVCSPTRYGILTGRYSWRSSLKSGVLNGYSKALIPPDRLTIASLLKQNGYSTACIGKWHLGWQWNNIEKGIDQVDFSKPIKNGPTTVGFDHFYGISASLDMPPYVYVKNDMPTALPDRETSNTGMQMWRKGPTGSDFTHDDCLPNLTRRASEYIRSHAASGQPYFLYFPMTAPHTPILPSAEFRGKSGLNPYADFVLMVDWAVSQVMQAIKESGMEENTLVIFTSDNGCSPAAKIEDLKALGHSPNYIFRGMKADLFDGGHHIPLMMQWPGKIKPHWVDQTVCLTDFLATFSSLTGYQLKSNEGEDSYNLLPLLLHPDYQQTVREATVHHSIKGSFTIRKGDWKLLLSPGSGGWSSPKPGPEENGLPKVQLYNMKTDIAETTNLYLKFPDKVAELKALMTKYVREGRSTPGQAQKNDGAATWDELKWMAEE